MNNESNIVSLKTTFYLKTKHTHHFPTLHGLVIVAESNTSN